MSDTKGTCFSKYYVECGCGENIGAETLIEARKEAKKLLKECESSSCAGIFKLQEEVSL